MPLLRRHSRTFPRPALSLPRQAGTLRKKKNHFQACRRAYRSMLCSEEVPTASSRATRPFRRGIANSPHGRPFHSACRSILRFFRPRYSQTSARSSPHHHISVGARFPRRHHEATRLRDDRYRRLPRCSVATRLTSSCPVPLCRRLRVNLPLSLLHRAQRRLQPVRQFLQARTTTLATLATSCRRQRVRR